MKKAMKKKWIGLALVLTLAVVGAASLTAFGANDQAKESTVQTQRMQGLHTVGQTCIMRGTHHRQTSSNTSSTSTSQAAAVPASNEQTATVTSNCQYPDCDGTHSNHQNASYGHHGEYQGHHGSSYGGGHHGGNHE